LSDRLAHVIRETTRALVRALTQRLAQHNVSFGHWAFLRILWQQDGLTQRELSEQAGVMEPTTFAALKSMEELGLVERRQLPENRKNVYVHLTPQGRALKAKLVPLAEEVNRVATRGVPADDIAAMRRALELMLANLGADAAVSRSLPPRPSRPSRISRSSRGSARHRRPG
jgi:MarR family transcriptional regulator, organic hydroperoxide resistance regulator